MTNESLAMMSPDAPVTRPGCHVTPEGRVVGTSTEVALEWEAPEDERTRGRRKEAELTEVAGIPMVESEGAASPPDHPDERTAFVSPQAHKNLRKEAGLSPNGVDGAGNKRTVEHEINVDVDVEGTLTHEGVNTLREAIEEAERTMQQHDNI